MAGNLIGNDTDVKRCVQFSGFSSTVTTSFSTTTAGAGITWDGNNVIYTTALSSVSIKKGTGFGAAVQSSFAAPDVSGVTYGLGEDGTNVYIVEGGTKAYKMSGFSATVADSFTVGSALRGFAWDGTRAYTGDSTANKLRQHSGFSATVVDSFTTGGTYNRDIAHDQTNIYSTQQGATVKFRQHSGFSSTISSSFTRASTEFDGIHWDSYPAAVAAATSYHSRMFFGLGL